MNITLNGTKITQDTRNLAFEKNSGVDEIVITVDTDESWSYKLDVKYPDKYNIGNDALYNIIDLDRNGNICSVTLTSEMLPFNGKYTMQLRGISGDKVYHSDTFEAWVKYSIEPGSTYDPVPSEFYQVEAKLDDKVNEAKQYAENAETASTRMPKISPDKTWLIWDVGTGNYVDTGVKASGSNVDAKAREDISKLSEEKANKIDVPVSAEVDENNLVSFKNYAGKVLFTLQLLNGGGSTENEGSLSPFAAVNWLDTVYAVGDNGRYAYNAWCPETVAYDATRQKIVFVQFHSDSHGGKFKERTMCLIDPYDPTVYTAVPNFPSLENGIGGLVVENGVWTVYGTNYRYRSSDGGETWETTAVVTKPARLFGVNKIDGVLYGGDDALDDTHNGWYYVSEDDGLNWTQHTFDFATQYALSCGEARFCKFKGELYVALRREGETGLLAKQVDGVWTVVYEELPNVTSDSSLLAFEDLIAISSIDRPNKKLVLSTWDGSALVVSKEVSFVGLTSSGDFHTPTYICGEDWQAVFFMMFGMRLNEYQSALNAALFGYKDGVFANTPTYETELVTYAWSDFLEEPYARATAVEVTDTALNWTPETSGVDALLNISVRVPTMHQVGPDGKVIEYGLTAMPQNIVHIPQRSFNTIQDIKTIGDRKYVCVVEMHPEWCGSFNHAARSVLPVKFMGIATPNVLDYDMTGAQHIATAYGNSSSSNATASVYRVVYNS